MRKLICVMSLAVVAFWSTAQEAPFSPRDLKKAEITLFRVSEFPTAPLEHSPGAEYVLDYKVNQKKMLGKAEIPGFKAVLSDSSNYISGIAKNCPFIGQYAVRVEGRKGSTEIVISRQNCPKMIYRLADANGRLSYIDLRKDNAIHPLLEKLLESI